ncbi:tyrosine-type recombinase/integrase [Virgibacillus senegalensis]|uniref:tyrosine-type recombinase/integrase n=1 Tax=Virgibacillus senegalensis TaxID=1499679 RepID=UPI00069D268C|nr:site-specific integrase [Virgibacillus senegalensis]
MREPKIYPLDSGGYGFRMDIGKDPKTGKRKRPRFGPYKSKTTARLERNKIMQQIMEGTFVEQKEMTLKDFLLRWLDHKRVNVSEGTYAHYKPYIMHHWIPNLGMAKINEVKPVHIQEIYDEYIENEVLSNQSIVHMHRVLNNAFNDAIKWEWAVRNPCTPIKPPRPEKYEMKVWDEFELQHFLEFSKGDRFYVAYLLALSTGMRKGEILALRWQDIDFSNKLLAVRQAVTRKKGGGYKIGETKSKNQRTISLFNHVLEELKTYRKQQMSFKMENRDKYEDQDLILAANNGSFILPRNLDRSWRPLMKKSGLKFIRFHDFRHTHATLMLKQGVHPKVVQERLGHSSITVTLDLYSHVLPNIQRAAAEQFGDEIFGAKNENKDSIQT